jgi:4-hydroxy-2-oxoheptanedioate aldolase
MKKPSETVDHCLKRGRTGERTPGLLMGIKAPEMVEALAGFDLTFLLITLEHSLINSAGDMAPMLRAADLIGLPAIAKLNSNATLEARDMLDAGAAGVMLPTIYSGDQLREVMMACRFPPLGTRGFCPISRGTRYGARLAVGDYGIVADFIKFTNEKALFIPVLESPEAVTNLDDILKVDVPIVALGPVDLAMSMGVSMQDPMGYDEIMRLLKGVIDKSHKAGKLVMCPIVSPPGAAKDAAKARTRLAETITSMDVDYPYLMDTQCFAIGVSELGNIVGLAQREGKGAASPAAAPEPPRKVMGAI